MDVSNLESGGEKKDPQRCGVFFVPKHELEDDRWIIVGKAKQIVECLHSSWEVWYEETVVDEKPTLSLYAKHKVPIFSRKYMITVVTPEENGEEEVDKEFEMVDDNRICRINFPQLSQTPGDMHFNAEVLPSHFISPEYMTGNDFFEEKRPHDVILNMGYTSIYGHKVVLALWSSYFDKLFYSHPKTDQIQEFEIKGVCCGAVQHLLDMCLNRREEFHNYEDCFDVNEVKAAKFLQMSVPLKLIKENRSFIVSGGYEGLILALVLADTLNLPLLLKRCEKKFRRYNEDQKKKFLHEYEERLKKLSLRTIFGFLNKTLNPDTIEELHENILPVKESEISVEPFESGVNSRTDVCLLVGDERFEVHKEYLAFWSPFFDRLFFGDFIEKDMVKMEIKEVDPQEFATLLRLIYPPGDVRIDDSNVEYLLKLADRFQMKSVLAMCCSYLARRVTENESHELIMNTLNLADQYFLVDAQISCFEKIRNMGSEDSKKFRWDYIRDLSRLSENTKYNLVVSI